ncbi:uncharacterized protein LOC109861942 [Pseudomyrmex gracilis]|uniref:uncharacterized protein LOC109861942 n=1 Tax=Pseudomyrmex gracilis TaxID=219809 RepID=UPI0009952C1A|nr:uncharacterized protein LOC109861942 [Pseudomyrmex gracilis]
MRVRGLDDSISPEELKEAVAAAGGCRPTEVKVGRARASSGGLLSAWVQCPLTAARKLAGARSIPVGWVRAPIEVLERRPLQCHRWLRRGHVITTCPYAASTEDRRSRCYQCGDRGHNAAGCDATPRCPLCMNLGRPAAHRLGSKACAPVPRKGKKKGAAKQAPGGGGSSAPTPPEVVTAAEISAEPASAENQGASQPPSSSALEEEMEVEVPPTV